MRIYISGNINGKAHERALIFHNAQLELESNGLIVQNSFLLVGKLNTSRVREGKPKLSFKENANELITICFRALLKCDAVIMLDGWQQCAKAIKEHNLAKLANKQIHYSTASLINALKRVS